MKKKENLEKTIINFLTFLLSAFFSFFAFSQGTFDEHGGIEGYVYRAALEIDLGDDLPEKNITYQAPVLKEVFEGGQLKAYYSRIIYSVFGETQLVEKFLMKQAPFSYEYFQKEFHYDSKKSSFLSNSAFNRYILITELHEGRYDVALKLLKMDPKIQLKASYWPKSQKYSDVERASLHREKSVIDHIRKRMKERMLYHLKFSPEMLSEYLESDSFLKLNKLLKTVQKLEQKKNSFQDEL